MIFSLLSFAQFAFAEPSISVPELEVKAQESADYFDLMEKNFSDREGVLGAIAADRLYNRAIRSFMLQSYKEATILFFMLVKDGSLKYDERLHQKAQWFLIESAEAYGSDLVLEEECLEIAKQESHPFFTEAIRKLLELYGRTSRDSDFQNIVSSYVDTGKVEGTDKIQYTLGKSFYWQGKKEESKGLLSSIPVDSLFFEKSQYFLGGILAADAEYEESIQLFSGVEERLKEITVNDKVFISSPLVGTATEEEQKVYELSILGLGRVYLEQGLFDDAIAAYARVPSTSEYYPEVIYELVWVYIKNKAWEDASRMIDIFLYGYPEHEYAIRLELIRGRIQMNAGNNEQASKTFNDSKKALEEVDALLKDLIGDEQAALQLFFSLRDSQSADPFSISSLGASETTSKLPYYAKEILKGQKDLLRAIDMSRSVQLEYEELIKMKRELSEMKELLLANKKLGAIQREKKDITEFQTRLLSLLYNSLMVEFRLLKEQSSGSGRKKIERLEENWIRKNRSFLNRSESSKEGYVEAHRTQVRSVQNEAEILLSKVAKMSSDLDKALMKYDRENRPKSQQQVISDLKKILDVEITEMHAMLKDIVSPSKMMLVMAYVDIDSSTVKEQNQRLFTEWSKMHERELKPYWNNRSGDKETLDKIWNDFSPYMSRMSDFENKLEQIQKSRISRVVSMLEEEESRIEELLSGYQNIQGSVDLVSLEASRQGFKNIRSIVTQNILDADLGLVKIQWNRFTRKENLLLSLKEERKKKETRHKTEFDIIKKKLPESTVKEVGAP
jgi:hypothetical protein